jgi:hypothetical protein
MQFEQSLIAINHVKSPQEISAGMQIPAAKPGIYLERRLGRQ